MHGHLPSDSDKSHSYHSPGSLKNGFAVDECQPCVGVAYDYGKYPKIVAVHSVIEQDSPLRKEILQGPRSNEFYGYQEPTGNQENRPDFGIYSAERLRHSIKPRFPESHDFLAYQNGMLNHRFPSNGFAEPNRFQGTAKQSAMRVQNERLVQKNAFPPEVQQFQHSRPQLMHYMHPKKITENLQFQPFHHNAHSVNRFQAVPAFGMNPARPTMNDVRQSNLSMLDASYIASQNGHAGPFYDQGPSINIRGPLHPQITSRSSYQLNCPSSTYPARPNYVNSSRKRTYDQINNEVTAVKCFASLEKHQVSVPTGFAFAGNDTFRPSTPITDGRMETTRLNVETQPPTRYQCFEHPNSNDYVDLAVVSAKRYTVENARPANDKIHQKKHCIANNTVEYTGKTSPPNIPKQWIDQEFFQRILLHENRYDLLQTLKEAALSGRELLLYVLGRLLATGVLKSSLILLDNLKRSDLSENVKEKVLSVIQEIIWGHPPRFDLWPNRAIENQRSSTSEATEIVISEDYEEESDESCYESRTSKEHIGKKKDSIKSLLNSKNIVDQADITGIDSERASVHENVLISHDHLGTKKENGKPLLYSEGLVGQADLTGNQSKRESEHENIMTSHYHLGTKKECVKSLLYSEDLDGQAGISEMESERASVHNANTTSNDPLDTKKENMKSWACSEGLVGQADMIGIESKRASVHKNMLTLLDHLGTKKESVKSFECPKTIVGKVGITGNESERASEPENVLISHDHLVAMKDILKSLLCSKSIDAAEIKCDGESMHKNVLTQYDHLGTKKESAKSLVSSESIVGQADITKIESERASVAENVLISDDHIGTRKESVKSLICSESTVGQAEISVIESERASAPENVLILQDPLSTKKDSAKSLPCSESIVGQADMDGSCTERVLVHENVLQRSPKNSCDRDLDDVGSKKQEVIQISALNIAQSEVKDEVNMPLSFDGDETLKHIQKEACNNSVDGGNCIEIEQNVSESVIPQGSQDCESCQKEATECEVSIESASEDNVDIDCFQTRDQCIQVEGIDNLSVNIDAFSDCERSSAKMNQTSFDEDFENNYLSIEKFADLEDSDLEILGNISISMDSQGNTIINKEISDEITLDDGMTIKGFKILKQWTEPLGKDASLADVNGQSFEATTQS